MTFPTSEHLRLEVQDDWASLANLVPNPDGDTGAWGFAIYGGGQIRAFPTGLELAAPAASTGATIVTDLAQVPLQPASSPPYRVRAQLTRVNGRSAAVTVQASVRCYAENRTTLLGTIGTTAHVSANGTITIGSVQPPAGTRHIALAMWISRNGGATEANDWVIVRDLVLVYGTAAEVTAYTPQATPGWVDIIGPTIELTVERAALELGTLTGSVRDVALDPTTNDLIRKGKRIRLTALEFGTTEDVWQPLFVGTLRNAKVTYDLKDPDIPASKRANIEISATDAVTVLANASRPEGVATVAELPWVLAGLRMPWAANGSSAPIGAATPVSRDQNRTALDQVLITRDSQLGAAWVDRFGSLQVYDGNSLPSTVVATLDESDYSEFGVDFDDERCINAVTLRLIRFNIATGETVEVVHGPYVNQASADRWGTQAAEYTVQGIPETDGGAALKALADQILLANADPQLRVNSMTLPIATGELVRTDRALLELGRVVRTVDTASSIDETNRIASIRHRITGGKWLMELTFVTPQSVSVPTITPSTPGVHIDPDLEIPDEGEDGTPPPAPSTPTVTARLGVITITWDGLDYTGQPMPADFKHVLAVVEDDPEDRIVGYLYGQGDSAYVTDAPYNVPVTAYLVAADTEDLLSAPSLTASATPVPLVAQDLDEQITEAIEAAQNSANGKNRVTYSTSLPGSTPNTAGDTWFVNTSGGLVVAQYRGNGGTSWTEVEIDGVVIANIDAGKITTGVLSAARIASLSISTDKLAANAVTADKIQAGAITAIKLDAEAIDGKTITGATIRSASAGERVVLRNDGSGGIIEFFSGLSSETPAYINPGQRDVGSTTVPQITVSSGGRGTYSDDAQVYLHAGLPGGDRFIGSKIVLDASHISSRADAVFQVVRGDTVVLGAEFPDPNSVYGPGINATAIDTGATPNVYIHPTNDILGRIGSMRSLKLNIEDLTSEHAADVLDLRARTFYDRSSCEARADYLSGDTDRDTSSSVRRRLGLIAEEVHEAGFRELVQYNDAGDAVSVNYDRLAVALIPVLREQRDSNVQLSADLAAARNENAALKNRVAALEGSLSKLALKIGVRL